MNTAIQQISLALVIANVLISYKGFLDNNFFKRYLFETDGILKHKEYRRLLSSGFLHVDWIHLAFNMLTLYSFSYGVFYIYGIKEFFFIYFGSLIGGNLFALFIHRNHGDYSAVGASGAVSGVLFSHIIIEPWSTIWFMPAWVAGVLFVFISMYGIKSQRDNIGHEAHLAGGVSGMLIALCFLPQLLYFHPLQILVILGPSLIFMWVIWQRPEILMIDNFFQKEKQRLEEEHKEKKFYNLQDEMDYWLDRINKNGINSLSRKERKRLKNIGEQLTEQEKNM